MKGIEKAERDSKRGMNSAKPEIEVEVQTEAQKKKEKSKVIGHSQKKVGSFFSSLIERTKDWMSDEIE